MASVKKSAAKRRRRASAAVADEGLTPLQYMVQVLRDESQTHAVRMDAAKTVAPYLHARLATAEGQKAGLEQLDKALLALVERAQERGGGVAGLVRR